MPGSSGSPRAKARPCATGCWEEQDAPCLSCGLAGPCFFPCTFIFVNASFLSSASCAQSAVAPQLGKEGSSLPEGTCRGCRGDSEVLALLLAPQTPRSPPLGAAWGFSIPFPAAGPGWDAQHNRQGKQGRRQTERWAHRLVRGSLADARSRFPSSSRCSHRPVPCGWAPHCPRGSPPPAPRRPLDLPGPAAPSLQPQPDFPRRPRAAPSLLPGAERGWGGVQDPVPLGKGQHGLQWHRMEHTVCSVRAWVKIGAGAAVTKPWPCPVCAW